MADSQRIEDLRRRVQKDPTSIAFAQLAEECRRAGNLQEAVDVCRAGLALHPGYLSARVTLGRALIELDDFDTALVELEYVLKSAPENLAAIRGLAEIHHRQGRLKSALTQYRAALLLARNDPDLQRTVDELSYQLEPPAAAEPDQGLSLDQVQDEFLQSLSSHEAAPAAELGREAGPESSQEATPVAGFELEPKAEATPESVLEPEPEALAAAIVPPPPSEPTPELVTPTEPVESVEVAEVLEGSIERERETEALAAAIVPALPSEPTPELVTPTVPVERVDVAETLEDTAERERNAEAKADAETQPEREHASLATETYLPVTWEAPPASMTWPMPAEREEVERLPEVIADREQESEPESEPEPEPGLELKLKPESESESESEPEPEPEPEQLEHASLPAAVVPDAVPLETAPALIPQPVLVERVDLEEVPEDTAERDHALRMLAALEQWIDAIHVVRAQPLA